MRIRLTTELPHLKSLSLEKVEDFMVPGGRFAGENLNAILDSAVNLEKLEICWSDLHGSKIKLHRGLAHLQSLSIDLIKFTIDQYKEILTKARSLEKIQIKNVRTKEDDLEIKCCASLKSFDIEGSAFNISQIRKLLAKTKNLEKLIIRNWGVKEVRELSAELPHLEIVRSTSSYSMPL